MKEFIAKFNVIPSMTTRFIPFGFDDWCSLVMLGFMVMGSKFSRTAASLPSPLDFLLNKCKMVMHGCIIRLLLTIDGNKYFM